MRRGSLNACESYTEFKQMHNKAIAKIESERDGIKLNLEKNRKRLTSSDGWHEST